jgi:dihydroxyacid dehydratase/phosphogluconate dehydratase
VRVSSPADSAGLRTPSPSFAIQGRGVFEGLKGAYPRALYRAMGYGDRDFDQPLIGIANSWGETNPGHFHLRKLAAWVKDGVRSAGGTPVEFNTIAPCDGICQGEGMHYILPLRDLIAASVELMARANRFDGLVLLCSCDKIVPGMWQHTGPARVFECEEKLTDSLLGGAIRPGDVLVDSQ